MQESEPNIQISEAELSRAGYTVSGKERYEKTLKDYSTTLFKKAVSFAEVDKEVSREVTHEHVKQAAYSIANSFGKPIKPKYLGIVRIGQYLCAVLVGLATNYLDKLLGTIGFVVAFTVGLILLYIETLKSKS